MSNIYHLLKRLRDVPSDVPSKVPNEAELIALGLQTQARERKLHTLDDTVLVEAWEILSEALKAEEANPTEPRLAPLFRKQLENLDKEGKRRTEGKNS